jgi:hypothetical protein
MTVTAGDITTTGQGGIAILAQSIGGFAGRPTCRAFAPARRSRAR